MTTTNNLVRLPRREESPFEIADSLLRIHLDQAFSRYKILPLRDLTPKQRGTVYKVAREAVYDILHCVLYNVTGEVTRPSSDDPKAEVVRFPKR